MVKNNNINKLRGKVNKPIKEMYCKFLKNPHHQRQKRERDKKEQIIDATN